MVSKNAKRFRKVKQKLHDVCGTLDILISNFRSVFDNILNVQLFVTSAPSSNDSDTISLALALELMYKKSRKDVMTGLKTQCKAGRPDWQQVLTEISQQSSYKVGTFRKYLKVIFYFLGDIILLWSSSGSRRHTTNL